MMYATTEKQFEERYIKLLNDPCVQKYQNYIKHIIAFIDRRNEWALCYRTKLPVRGSNTNNLCESAMMVMKDCILQRIKAYNIVQIYSKFIVCIYIGVHMRCV